MSREVYLPGLEGLTNEPFNSLPVGSEYVDSLQRLVLLQAEGVTHFYGAPLDLDEHKNVWMSPVEVDDGGTYSYFQILYVNTTPVEALNDSSLPVSLLDIDEASYKLTPVDHPGYEQLDSQFIGDKKHVLIRHCKTGMAYYPRPVTPVDSVSVRENHTERVIRETGLREPEVSIVLSKPSDDEHTSIDIGNLHTVHSRRYSFNGGDVYSYGMLLDDDPWKYYELFTPTEIDKMPKDELLVRIDSGCDIGQIYDDCGCDCREQLHTALTDIQQAEKGAVIHIPSQDGRGYGAATKMETEGLKRGVEVATNHGDSSPVNTIVAAERVLGKNFDIRTYDGAGKILEMLGVESIILQTDNRKKTDGLTASGLRVTRKATNTSGSNGSAHHIAAKHKHGDIYFCEEDA